ncbi:uncharacterized protein BP01DRAFT_358844 [Aspergillus saccharolyticus JOP 1030-1]|uniref:Uncharacterized protein n=1 Tax=Aspergillus saccharolyticus JOP 1030-1 TaxID=1450539 RepID=A0A318Z7H0_9EURO|nr:hypothetical protein BP01DRAFT_358844 [Aspergillus saccharolyticus JOP 1030-1]PYH43059.1 hypothetical protein BP01DRAFT_358844 [Aspergillus saccharolyticus JOP 1030-1]
MEPFSYTGKLDKVAEEGVIIVSILAATLHVFMVLSLAPTILTRNKNCEYPPSRFHGATPLKWPTDYTAERARIKTRLEQPVRPTKRIPPSTTSASSSSSKSSTSPPKHSLLPPGRALELLPQFTGPNPHLQPDQPPGDPLLHMAQHPRDLFVRRDNHSLLLGLVRAPVGRPPKEALQCLRGCSNLLSIGGQWWLSVRHGKENSDRIVDLTVERLSQKHHHSFAAGAAGQTALPQSDSLAEGGIRFQRMEIAACTKRWIVYWGSRRSRAMASGRTWRWHRRIRSWRVSLASICRGIGVGIRFQDPCIRCLRCLNLGPRELVVSLAAAAQISKAGGPLHTTRGT